MRFTTMLRRLLRLPPETAARPAISDECSREIERDSAEWRECRKIIRERAEELRRERTGEVRV